jgi:hypothetical protein
MTVRVAALTRVGVVRRGDGSNSTAGNGGHRLWSEQPWGITSVWSSPPPLRSGGSSGAAYRGSRESLNSWGRLHSTRATDMAAPPTTDIHVGSWSPHRICPGPGRSCRPLTVTGLSAVHTGGAAQSFLAARSDRAVARRPYRAKALTPCRTGRPAGAGPVPRTGREPGGDGEGTTDCTFLGGPVLSTGCGFRPISSRPYRAGGGSLRTGHGAVPPVLACRSRASQRFWWTQHNNRLHPSIAVVTPLVPSGAPTPAPGGAGPRSQVRRSVGLSGDGMSLANPVL